MKEDTNFLSEKKKKKILDKLGRRGYIKLPNNYFLFYKKQPNRNLISISFDLKIIIEYLYLLLRPISNYSSYQSHN